jgi:curli production assembly/transport component CsgG
MRFLILSVFIILLGGCSTVDRQIPDEGFSTEPTLATETKIGRTLAALPPAKDIVTLSVYQFNDQTGQNKPGETPQYSRAVTQGGLAMLKKALLDAGNQSWFRVLERGGLQNLLQERKIIRSMREQYTTPSGEKLPPLGPLLYAGLLLEGGVIAYESNITTGGAGARYLGIGGDTQYRRDMVTVALRAVSVTTGEVLIAVNTSKTILSKSVRGGLFYFVSYDQLAEAEAGYTANEPPQLAVRQAIEMAVYAMIMEGYQKGIWEFNTLQAGRAAYQAYLECCRGAVTSKKTVQKERPQPLVESEKKTVLSSQHKTIAAPEKQSVQSNNLVSSIRPRQRAAAPPPKAVQNRRQAVSFPKAEEKPASGWYIQVLAVKSFGEEENRILKEIKQAGLPVTIQQASIGSIRYYRILVGPYRSKEKAAQYRSKLAKLAASRKSNLTERVYTIGKL